MGFILILVSTIALAVEVGAASVAVWLVCLAIGAEFNLPLTIAVVGVCNLVFLRKLFDGEGE